MSLSYTEEQLSERKRRLKWFLRIEVVSAILILGTTASIMLALPEGEEQRDEFLTPAIVSILAVLCAQSLVMTRLGMSFILEPRTRLRSAAPFRGWTVTALTPISVFCLFIPWISAGTLDVNRGISMAALTVQLLLLVTMGTLAGPLVCVAVLLPIELTIRGIVRLRLGRTKEDRTTALGNLKMAGLITYLVVVCLLIGGIASIESPQSRGSVWLTILGVTGNDGVEHPWLLWLGRLMFLLFVGSILWAFLTDRRNPKK